MTGGNFLNPDGQKRPLRGGDMVETWRVRKRKASEELGVFQGMAGDLFSPVETLLPLSL